MELVKTNKQTKIWCHLNLKELDQEHPRKWKNLSSQIFSLYFLTKMSNSTMIWSETKINRSSWTNKKQIGSMFNRTNSRGISKVNRLSMHMILKRLIKSGWITLKDSRKTSHLSRIYHIDKLFWSLRCIKTTWKGITIQKTSLCWFLARLSSLSAPFSWMQERHSNWMTKFLTLTRS
jgi:hypothetical protein